MLAQDIRFRILGPFEAGCPDGLVALPRGQLRWLLASFVLEPRRLLSEQRLIEQVWDADRASTAALRSSISRLRTWFELTCLAESVEIVHQGTGYAMTVPDGAVDADVAVRRFEELRHYGTEPATVAQLLAIVSMWRAPVLADAPSVLRHHPVAVKLEHLHGRCVVALADAATKAGECERVLDLMRQAARDAPFEEQIQAAFIQVALAAGRRTEALRHYEEACARIRADLGVEPSSTLHAAVAAEQQVRARRATGMPRVHLLPAAAGEAPEKATLPQPPPATVIPGLVPPLAAADFTGRSDELGRIVNTAFDPHRHGIVYVSGPPGIGKTEVCLAATAEIRARADLPVLFAAMDGSSGRPRDPHDVLKRFVRALDPGTPPDDDPHTLADRYRALLSAKPALIVLDEVCGADQVLPFLPPNTRCMVIANGRPAAPAVPGCVCIDLCSFSEQEGEDFVARIIGRDRATADLEALHRIHWLVDGHPVGLRIAALRLASNPHWSMRRLADLLQDSAGMLNVLRHDGLSMLQVLEEMVGHLDLRLRRDLDTLCAAGSAAPSGPLTIDRADVAQLPDETLDCLHGARLIGMPSLAGADPAAESVIWVPSLVRSYTASGART